NSVNARKKSKSVNTPIKKKVWKSTGKVFKTVGYIWKTTGLTFTLVGNVCPLTRIATATIVPPRESIPIVKSTNKPVVTLVYTRKPKAKNVLNKMEPNKSWGSSSNVSTSPTDCKLSKSSFDNGTEFVNQTLRDYYEEVGISHETSVARSPQQNGVVERRNHTLIEAARTMLIYAQAPLFLWAEAVATVCFTQNRSIIRLRYGKTLYELLHRLVRPSSSSTSFVPPSRNDWDLLFQPMFDELLNPPSSVVNQAAEVIAPIAEVIP
nr:putative ribonuclease H-like domain-containing protein [Tanacetum cinerariifolium]